MRCIKIVSALISSAAFAHSLSFDLKRVEKRCFFKEAQDQVVTLEYKIFNKVFDSPLRKWVTVPGNTDQPVFLSVKSDDNKDTANREINGFGNFTFFTEDQTYDRYQLCFEIPKKSLAKMRSPDLRIEYKLYARSLKDPNYEKIVKDKQTMSLTERSLTSLRQQCYAIMRTIQMRKSVERMFRDESESVANRVSIWAAITMIVCVGLAVVQMKYMRWFFISKKIM